MLEHTYTNYNLLNCMENIRGSQLKLESFIKNLSYLD